MAEYTLDYTGAQINELLGKINSTQTTANQAFNLSSNNAVNIYSLQQATAYETTTFTAKGVTVSLWKWGRLVYIRANADITSAWTAGSSAAVASGLSNEWLPVSPYLTASLGAEMGGTKYIVFDASGNFYHNGGSSMASGDRLRFSGCFISKA